MSVKTSANRVLVVSPIKLVAACCMLHGTNFIVADSVADVIFRVMKKNCDFCMQKTLFSIFNFYVVSAMINQSLSLSSSSSTPTPSNLALDDSATNVSVGTTDQLDTSVTIPSDDEEERKEYAEFCRTMNVYKRQYDELMNRRKRIVFYND
jgi:hypothetical protein